MTQRRVETVALLTGSIMGRQAVDDFQDYVHEQFGVWLPFDTTCA
ncbi:hypothetical protein [Haloarcula sediminis]|nr:hypothetical protein [Haloarcula sp. CK38]